MQGSTEEQVISATFDVQLLVGAGMIALCVVIHGFALFGLNRVIRGERTRERLRHMQALSLRGGLITLLIVLALIATHFLEIWLFGFLYYMVDATVGFREALYVSTISYSTVGYNDAYITPDWRMVAALESILGVILLGWSTAFFVRVLGRLEDDKDDETEAGESSG
jgi:hypothetical protein